MMIFAAYYDFTIDCNCNIAAYNPDQTFEMLLIGFDV
jgi:hypothetical protein